MNIYSQKNYSLKSNVLIKICFSYNDVLSPSQIKAWFSTRTKRIPKLLKDHLDQQNEEEDLEELEDHQMDYDSSEEDSSEEASEEDEDEESATEDGEDTPEEENETSEAEWEVKQLCRMISRFVHIHFGAKR